MTLRRLTVKAAVSCAALFAPQVPLPAQDTLHLGALHESALRQDPRARQAALQELASSLRLRNVDADWLPQLSLLGEAFHQSDVTKVSLPLATGRPPQPPKDRWQAIVSAQQLLYDAGTLDSRRAVERARLAESLETIRVAQHRLLGEVNEAFFTAYLMQERAAEIDALMVDLRARLEVIGKRVTEGAALPGEAAAVEAELLRAEQSRAEVVSTRRAALAVLARLTGAPVSDRALLALPALAASTRLVRDSTPASPADRRPEFAQFSRARERVEREAALAGSARKPRVYAFGQAGVGRPGLDQFRSTPDELWIAGIRVEWRPWSWGSVARQQEAIRIQSRILETEEEAFAAGLDRSVQAELADMDRLAASAEGDDRIIALRERIERQGRAQLDEGVITAADYVQLRTDVLEARLTRERHRAEAARAAARYLTTLGITPR